MKHSNSSVLAYGYLLNLDRVANYVFGEPVNLNKDYARLIELKSRLGKLGFSAHFCPKNANTSTVLYLTVKDREIYQNCRGARGIYRPVDTNLKLTTEERDKLTKFARKCDSDPKVQLLMFSYEGF